jgi:hypothetical protein
MTKKQCKTCSEGKWCPESTTARQEYNGVVLEITVRKHLPQPERIKRLTDTYSRLLPHAKTVLGWREGRYLIELRDGHRDTWMAMESHSNIDDARYAACSYSKHCDERSRVVDTSTGQTIEIWNEGMLEEEKGKLQ